MPLTSSLTPTVEFDGYAGWPTGQSSTQILTTEDYSTTTEEEIGGTTTHVCVTLMQRPTTDPASHYNDGSTGMSSWKIRGKDDSECTFTVSHTGRP